MRFGRTAPELVLIHLVDVEQLVLEVELLVVRRVAVERIASSV